MMDEFEIGITDNITHDPYENYTQPFSSIPQRFAATMYNVTEGSNMTQYDTISKRDPLYILIPITVIYAVILLTGLVGNVSTCVVIARNKHMHTATNYYLFSLAVSDLLLLVSGLPQEMYFIWWRVYPDVLGEKVCILQGFAAETSANATVLTITAFTVERYVAICHPFQSHTFSKLSRAVRLVMVIWLVALGLAVPQAIQFGVLQRKAEDGTDVVLCTVTSELVQHAFEISTLVFFVAPMTLITVLYALIGLKLRRSRLLHAAKRASIGSSSTDRGNDRAVGGKSSSPQNYVIRMLVAVVVAFFICWAPFHAQRLLAMYARSNNSDSPVLLTVYKTLTYTSGILYYMSTTVNPVLYHIMSHKFREAFKSTLADPCGCNQTNSNKRRAYSALLCRQNNRHMSLQQQQLQRQQHVYQLQRRISNSGDLQQQLPVQLLPNKGQHESAMNQARQQFRRHNSGDSGDQSLTPKERRLHGQPVESSLDVMASNSYPMYVHRPRGSSNSSQTTTTTSLGKLSLNGGNNNGRSESALAASDETTIRGGAVTSNGHCRKQLKLDLIVINGRKMKTCDVTSKDAEDINNVTCQGKCKQKSDGNCVGQRSGNSIAAITKRLKSAPRPAAIGVLAKKLRSLSLPGNTKSIFAPQHKVEQQNEREDIHEPRSRVSTESAKSTISDSSLQDLDETEFVGSELACYMGELNQQRLVR